MREIIIACSMMEDEIKKTVTETGSDIPLLWVDRGLHEYPEQLRGELTEKIAQCEKDYDTIVLAYGLCGNGTVGLVSAKARLVIPHFDVCIRIMTSMQPGVPPEVDIRSLYYTRGWLESNLVKSEGYERCLKKYGAKKTQWIYREMVKNYRSICLLETTAYDIAACQADACHMAEVLGLELTTQPGTLRILKKMVTHQWDDEFIICEPGEALRQEQFFPNWQKNPSIDVPK